MRVAEVGARPRRRRHLGPRHRHSRGRAAQDLPALLPRRARRAAHGGRPRASACSSCATWCGVRAAASSRRARARARAAASSSRCAPRRRQAERSVRWRASSSSKTKRTSPRGSSSTSRPRATRSSSPPTADARSSGSSRGRGGFDLVLLDLMLPGLSGFEVLRRMRAAGVLVPVLVLTAKDETAGPRARLEEGADDYLTKPFHLDELLARVRGLLRRRRWDGASEPARARAAPDRRRDGALRPLRAGDAAGADPPHDARGGTPARARRARGRGRDARRAARGGLGTASRHEHPRRRQLRRAPAPLRRAGSVAPAPHRVRARSRVLELRCAEIACISHARSCQPRGA